MILTADEVVRSIRGSCRLIQREADGLRAFDTSFEGFWHSFAAIILAAPAFVVAVADARLIAGKAVPGAGLFDDIGLVAREALVFVMPWIAFPALMIGFVRLMGLDRRYVGYVVAYNWSAVIVAIVLAVPALLHALGLATTALATFYALAFSIVLLQYRWFLACTALGVTGGVGLLVVGLDVATSFAATTVVRTLIG